MDKYKTLAKITLIRDRAIQSGDQRKGKRYINALMSWSRRVQKHENNFAACPRSKWHFSYNLIAKQLRQGA